MDIMSVITDALPCVHVLQEHKNKKWEEVSASVANGSKVTNSSFCKDWSTLELCDLFVYILSRRENRRKLVTWLNSVTREDYVNGRRETFSCEFSHKIGFAINAREPESPRVCYKCTVILALDPKGDKTHPFRCVSMFPVLTDDASYCSDSIESGMQFRKQISSIVKGL